MLVGSQPLTTPAKAGFVFGSAQQAPFEVGGRIVKDDAPALDDGNLICQIFGFGEVMRT